MLLLLLLLNTSHTLGIGAGIYPNGTLSIKFCSAPTTVFQLTAGFGGLGGYYGDMALGGRALFGMSSGGNSVQYTHFLGVGAGIHTWNNSSYHGIYHESGAWILGEGFYECELFFSPEVPLSVEIGIGLDLVLANGFGLGWGPLLGIHYYLK
ncbi:MAG: hypothetical protein WC614_10285 [bacterium]